MNSTTSFPVCESKESWRESLADVLSEMPIKTGHLRLATIALSIEILIPEMLRICYVVVVFIWLLKAFRRRIDRWTGHYERMRTPLPIYPSQLEAVQSELETAKELQIPLQELQREQKVQIEQQQPA